jgi:hypothetical protein
MIVWADRWQADECVDICLTKLAEVDITTLQVPDANSTLFALPESVTRAAAFSGFQTMCEKWLVEQFGDVYVVISRIELLQSFCTLSFPAVFMWAGLDGLAVHTENDVAVLLAHWHNGEVGQQCSEEEVLQLGQLLRVGNLTCMFRRLMLPKLVWFERHVEQMYLFTAIWENEGTSVVAAGRAGLKFPAAWYAAARQGILPPTASNRGSFTVHASEVQLDKMLQQDAAGTCHEVNCPIYWYGYYWKPYIMLKQGKMQGYIRCISHGPVPTASCVKFAGRIHGRDIDTFISGQRAWGFENLFTDIASPVTSKEQLQPHMTNGCLEVPFKFSNVN